MYDPTEDGLYEEADYPMVRQYSALAQARMHPRATVGGLVLLAALVTAGVLLAQRTGPTRFERLRERVDPRRWIPGDRIRDLGERARSGASDIYHRATDAFPAEEIQRGARGAGRYARDHAKEGGALLALVAIAGAVAAVASQSDRFGGRS